MVTNWIFTITDFNPPGWLTNLFGFEGFILANIDTFFSFHLVVECRFRHKVQ